MSERMFDVYEVEIRNPGNRRLMESNLTEEAAESYIKFAVYRRGVDTHFYTKEPRDQR